MGEQIDVYTDSTSYSSLYTLETYMTRQTRALLHFQLIDRHDIRNYNQTEKSHSRVLIFG